MIRKTDIATDTRIRTQSENIIIVNAVVTKAVIEVAKRVQIDPDVRNMKNITAIVSVTA